MPAGDGTGPAGMGSMTGRAAGFCAGYPSPGYMNPYGGRYFTGGFGMGRGVGPGFGRGRGRGFVRGRGIIHGGFSPYTYAPFTSVPYYAPYGPYRW